jgi:hypothetical protein
MEQKKEQLRIIKQRTIDFLRQNSHGALYNGDGSKCTDWLAEELLEAGPYPGTLIYKDIDYDDQSLNAWRSYNHLDRLRAILVDEGPALFADSGRMDKLLALLRYWLQADPNSANWFHNQIGSPKYMGIIALLMGDQLPEDRPSLLPRLRRRMVQTKAQALRPLPYGTQRGIAPDEFQSRSCLFHFCHCSSS